MKTTKLLEQTLRMQTINYSKLEHSLIWSGIVVEQYCLSSDIGLKNKLYWLKQNVVGK